MKDDNVLSLGFSAIMEDNPDDPAVPFQRLMTEEEDAIFQDSVRPAVNYSVSVTTLVKDVLGKDLVGEPISTTFKIGMQFFLMHICIVYYSDVEAHVQLTVCSNLPLQQCHKQAHKIM